MLLKILNGLFGVGVLSQMPKFDHTKIGHYHLSNGKCVREDTLTDEQGKKYTLKDIEELEKASNPKKTE